MATITKNGAKGHHKFTLTVTEKSTSVANNTSSLEFSFTISPVSGVWDWANWGSKISYTVNINGTTYTGTIPSYACTSTVTLKSGTQSVTHNADGTKSISYSFSVTDAAGQSYTCGNASASGTMALTTIPRKATILTAQNFSDGVNPTITYSNPAGNAVTKLEAAIYNNSGTQSYAPYREITKTGTSYTFPLTEAEKENLLRATQSGNSINVRFYVRTTIGDAVYLSDPVERTFSINNADPIITASVVDGNDKTFDLTGDRNKLIKYYSNAVATMTAQAQKGAVINEDSYTIRNGDISVEDNAYPFAGVESNVFTFYVEDSRGNVGEGTITLPMVEYTKLTCNIANTRPDALGNMDVICNGDYFNDSFGNKENTLTVQYRYTISGNAFSDDDWQDMNVTITGNTYVAYASFEIPDFEQTQSYSFETRAIDLLDTITSTKSSVKSKPMFHWGENDFVFEVPVTFNAGVINTMSTEATSAGESDTYDGSKTITGNLRLKGKNSNYGNFLLFGDSNYCYINEPNDDEMLIHARKIHLDASGGVYVDGYAIPILEEGIWTPALNSSAISSYTTRYGWYMKMGQTVTVGFYIKATCKSGYQTTSISISGVPFTAMYSAAGGGMCSGAYVSANNNFQCYVVETSGLITTRTQACNNTASTNLTTSASGCFYRSSGGEITLSGTITFIADS